MVLIACAAATLTVFVNRLWWEEPSTPLEHDLLELGCAELAAAEIQGAGQQLDEAGLRLVRVLGCLEASNDLVERVRGE